MRDLARRKFLAPSRDEDLDRLLEKRDRLQSKLEPFLNELADLNTEIEKKRERELQEEAEQAILSQAREELTEHYEHLASRRGRGQVDVEKVWAVAERFVPDLGREQTEELVADITGQEVR